MKQNRRQFHLRLEPQLFDRIVERAERQDRTIQWTIVDLIKRALDTDEGGSDGVEEGIPRPVQPSDSGRN